MKRLAFTAIVAAILASNSASQPLSGTYTIGGGGADYDSIGHAVDTLIANGISGPVVFSISPGEYTEQVVITEIVGATSENTITFQSLTGIPGDVLWQFSPTFTRDYVVLVDGADHLRFLDLSIFSGFDEADFSTGIRLKNQVDDILISGNTFTGNGARTGSLVYKSPNDPGPVSHITISENEFYDFGEAAITLANSGTPAVRAVISGNLIYDPESEFGISIISYDSLIVTNNVVVADDRAISSADCPNRMVVNNHITAGYYGLFIVGGGGGAGPLAGLVANNIVIAGTSSTAAGIILNGNISGLKVFHNTVYATEPVFAGGSALYLFQPATVQGPYQIMNNLFVHIGPGLALRAPSTGASYLIDHNNFYTNGENLANWAGTLCPDLQSLQSASGQNANSANIEVLFEDPLEGDLHLASCSIGEPGLKGIGLSEVPLDIDGEVRDVIDPYMGADETFDAPPNLFTARRDFAVQGTAHRFDSGDLDGDGSVDIAVAVAPQQFYSGGVTAFVNDGSGEHFTPNELNFSDDDIWTVEIANIAGNDALDLITTTDDTIWISYAAGGGTFFQAEPLPGCPSCLNDDIDAVDLDGDGDQDLMLRYEGDISMGEEGNIIDYLNRGGGDFSPTSNTWNGETVMHPAQTSFADFNNDGLADIVVSDVINSQIAVQMNLGLDGSDEWLGFDNGVVYPVSNKDLFPADFDGDDKADVITQEFFDILSVDSLTLLRNTGEGVLGPPEFLDTDNYREPVRFVPMDYDVDGDLDLVTANVTGDISLLLNDGKGLFKRVVACDTTAGIGNITWHKDMLVDDFNGDERPDVALLWSNAGADTLTVYLNAGWIPTSVDPLVTQDVLPNRFGLLQNYPNPFNPMTTISYELPASSYISLKVYNILGQEVTTLIDGLQEAGFKKLEWDATGVASGVYLYRLSATKTGSAQTFTSTKRMILLR